MYQAGEGDTVEGVAAKFGLDPLYIQVNNAELCVGGPIRTGQSIVIPPGNGILHEVRDGETLRDIAVRYNVAAADIETANHLGAPEEIVPAMILFVPNGQLPPATPISAC